MIGQLINSCHGDCVSFQMMLDSHGYHKAFHVTPLSSHMIPSEYIGTVCSNKGHGIITRHDNEEDVSVHVFYTGLINAHAGVL